MSIHHSGLLIRIVPDSDSSGGGGGEPHAQCNKDTKESRN